MNKLINEIENTILLGRSVEFSSSMGQLKIKVTYEKEDSCGSCEQQLPLADHVYDSKVADCLNFINNKISEEIE